MIADFKTKMGRIEVDKTTPPQIENCRDYIAVDLLKALVGSSAAWDLVPDYTPKQEVPQVIANLAVDLTDCLIKKLKEQ